MFTWLKRKPTATEATEIDIFDAPPVVLGRPMGRATPLGGSSGDQTACLNRAEELIRAARSVA